MTGELRRRALRGVAWAMLLLALVPTRAWAVVTIHVDPGAGSDVNDGSSWALAVQGIPRALALAETEASAGRRATIRLAAGTHSIGFTNVRLPLVMLGGWDPMTDTRDSTRFPTVLDAGTSSTGLELWASASGTILDGLTIQGSAGTGAALSCAADARLQNLIVRDAGNIGIGLGAGSLIASRVERTGDAGIVVSASCRGSTVIDSVVVQDAGTDGIFVLDALSDCGPGSVPLPNVHITNVVLTGCGWNGIGGTCCPEVRNVLAASNAGYGLNIYDPFNEPMRWPVPYRASFVTSVGNELGGFNVSRLDPVLIENSISWGNVGPDLTQTGNTVTTRDVLSVAPLPGTRNIVGVDPLLVGPVDDQRLSSVAAGQPAESPARDASASSAASEGMGDRTTRTDGVLDDGLADLGWHALPSTCGLRRGVEPWALTPYLAPAVLPLLDVGAAIAPPLLFYEMDCGGILFVSRERDDIDLRWQWQELER